MIQPTGKFKLRPKSIFLLDGLGALLSAILLCIVLRTFNQYIGISKTTLTYLSWLAVLFSIYSLTCFFVLSNHWKPFLILISIANLLYGTLTLGIIIYNYHYITLIGIIYFLAEIAIIYLLVFIELKMVIHYKNQ